MKNLIIVVRQPAICSCLLRAKQGIVDGASEVYIVCVFENKACFFSKIRYVFLKYGMFLKKKGMFFSQLFHIFQPPDYTCKYAGVYTAEKYGTATIHCSYTSFCLFISFFRRVRSNQYYLWLLLELFVVLRDQYQNYSPY